MIIDGKLISQSLKDAMKMEVEALEQQYGRRPCLMVIIVGDNPASRSYVRGKIKATEYCGFDGHLVELPEDCTEPQCADTGRRCPAAHHWRPSFVPEVPPQRTSHCP